MSVVQSYPMANEILFIANYYPAIIVLRNPVNYVVNQFISIRCPPEYGMTQIDNMTGKILYVFPTFNVIALDIDSRGFDSFLTVLSPIQVPQAIPAGETDTLDAAFINNTARAGYTPV